MKKKDGRIEKKKGNTLKSSIKAKSGKKGKMSSIFNKGHSFKNAIASLISLSFSTTCLAIRSQSFFLSASSSSGLFAFSFACSKLSL